MLSAELGRTKEHVAELAAEVDAADTRGVSRVSEAEADARRLRYSLHVEGRETLQAVQLCRQSVQEIALMHAALEASLGAVEAPTMAPAAPLPVALPAAAIAPATPFASTPVARPFAPERPPVALPA